MALGGAVSLMRARALILEPSTLLRCYCYFLPVQRGLRSLRIWCKCLDTNTTQVCLHTSEETYCSIDVLFNQIWVLGSNTEI